MTDLSYAMVTLKGLMEENAEAKPSTGRGTVAAMVAGCIHWIRKCLRKTL